MSHPRIFVHIPSYRDRECQWTVRSLFDNARYPERIFVGICWQTVPDLDADCFQIETCPSQVRAEHFHIDQAQGLGWARQQAQRLWQQEEYSLQIDSHMRFVPDWDVAMLEMLEACESADPVLTVYPPGYIPPDRLIEPDRPAVQCVKRFLPNGLLEFSAETLAADVATDRPIPTAACAGGFIFGSSRILRDVPADPLIYFNGEEPNLALRLWTAGFDLFSPCRTLLYHYYERKDGSRHWDDSLTANSRGVRTLRRMRALCEPGSVSAAEVAELGPYGLGTRRTLAEYEAFSGVDFTGHTIADYAMVFPFVRQTAQSRPPPLPSDALQPADVRLFLLDGEGLLFREDRGEFYRLNGSATFAWCAREEGYSWDRIAREQAATRDIPVDDATRELSDLAAHWLGQGLLRQPGETPNPVPGARRRGPCFDPGFFEFVTHTYELLGVSMNVRYGDRELEGLVHPVLAHLRTAPASAPAHSFTVARILGYVYLFRDDTLVHHGENPAELAPPLKFQLLDRAIERQNVMLQIHAGAVQCHGCLVLLPGQPGDGKTTLTLRLVAAGGTYFSDEVVLLERGGNRIRPVPISPCIKSAGVTVLEPHLPGLAELPVHDREDGFKVRYLPPLPDSMPSPGHSAEARLLVFRRYVAGSPQVLRRLAPLEAFGRLMDHCVAIPRPLVLADAQSLVAMVRRLDCYELTGSDLEQDADVVLGLCRQSAGAAPRGG
jgi:hypothetical protein